MPGCQQGGYVTGVIGIGLPLCVEMAPETVLETLRRLWHVNRISAYRLLKKSQLRIATKNINTEKIITVEVLYGLLGNNTVGLTLRFSSAISNSTCRTSAMMRRCRLTNLCQRVFIVNIPSLILYLILGQILGYQSGWEIPCRWPCAAKSR